MKREFKPGDRVMIEQSVVSREDYTTPYTGTIPFPSEIECYQLAQLASHSIWVHWDDGAYEYIDSRHLILAPSQELADECKDRG